MKCGVLVLPLVVVLAALWAPGVTATEVTFDMGPHEMHCFYDVAEKGTPISLEFQVWVFGEGAESKETDETSGNRMFSGQEANGALVQTP